MWHLAHRVLVQVTSVPSPNESLLLKPCHISKIGTSSTITSPSTAATVASCTTAVHTEEDKQDHEKVLATLRTQPNLAGRPGVD